MERSISSFEFEEYLEKLLVFYGEELTDEFIIENEIIDEFREWMQDDINDDGDEFEGNNSVDLTKYTNSELEEMFADSSTHLLEENGFDEGYRFAFFRFVYYCDSKLTNKLYSEIESEIHRMNSESK